jgi:integrase
MQHKTIARGLLKDCTLNAADAARLILETQELLGPLSADLSRRDLLLLMRRVIRAGSKVIGEEEHTVSLEYAAWTSVDARSSYLRPVSLRDLKYYVRRLLRVKQAPVLMLRHMTTRECRQILQKAFGEHLQSYIKGRAILHSIFEYGMRREWCSANPVSRIEVPQIREKVIEPLSIEEVKRLQAATRYSDMQLSLNLMLYGGIRPSEVARLKIEDISWKENVVIIRPQTSKTGGGRLVPLRGCRHLTSEQRIIPHNWYRRWKELRMKAGFTHWVPDACRHTFASYYAAHFRNLPALQLEMGHSDLGLLRSRYMRPVICSTAREFWKLSQT